MLSNHSRLVNFNQCLSSVRRIAIGNNLEVVLGAVQLILCGLNQPRLMHVDVNHMRLPQKVLVIANLSLLYSDPVLKVIVT